MWLLEKKQVIDEYIEKNREVVPGGIVFAGSSLMYNFPIEEYMKEIGIKVYNRGICGFEIEEYMNILDVVVLDLKPDTVYINIGTNDLGNPEYTIEDCLEKYDLLIKRIEEKIKDVKIVFIAYYPVNPDTCEELMKEQLLFRTNEKICKANEKIKEMALRHGQEYIDLNKDITDEKGCLKNEYSIDGVHINKEGYDRIFEALKKYIEEEKK